MLEIKWTRPVKRDLKKYKHQKDVIRALQEIIVLLVSQMPFQDRRHGSFHFLNPLLSPLFWDFDDIC